MYRLLVQGVTDYAIYMLDTEGTVANWNAGAERAKGYTAEEIVGRHFSCFYAAAEQAAGTPEKGLSIARETGRFEAEGWRLRKDGSRFWAHVVIDAIHDDDGVLVGFAKITRDCTERRRTERRIVHLAHHDSLTGLPNRAALMERLTAALDSAVPRCRLLYVDLDRFKPVNDTLGHAAGDELLKAVAGRLTALVSSDDMVARIGGDEFAVLCDMGSDRDEIARLADRMVCELKRPFEIAGVQVIVGGSIGIAFAPEDGTTPSFLLRNADLALYSAKKEGRSCFRFYDAVPNDDSRSRQHLENALRHAIVAREFELHYEPIVALEGERVRGFEALLRWRRDGELVEADEFVTVSEDMGQMPALGAWVLQTACNEAMAWSETLTVSVNISRIQMRDSDFLETVKNALRTSGLSPGRLELEISEAAMMDDPAAALSALGALRDMGVLMTMDDFGTGCFSLSFIQTMSLTRIKIDRSLVQDVVEKPKSIGIVRAFTGLCNGLGVEACAEGVDTEEQRRILRQEGVAAIQGSLVGSPMPPGAVPAFLGSWANTTGTRTTPAASGR